jgi:pimeloyl-ACP methyl ester carboxylesterase
VFLLGLVTVVLGWAGATAGQAAPGGNDSSSNRAQSTGQGAIAGEWQGTLARQHLVLKIEQPNDASLNGTLTLPDQGNVSLPFDTLTWEHGTVRAELKRLGATYEGKLSADGTEINGTWSQGGATLALVFHRPGALAKFTLSPKTQGRVPLTPCRNSDGNVEGLCGKYEVYENRQSKTGRKIALNIMVLPALAAKSEADPFFALAGGPGQSATEAYPLAGYVSKIRTLRDIVLVDQRGTGQSNQLPCALQDLNDPQVVLGEPYSLDKIRECREASDKKADTTQYTTSIAADDLDEVREALGYDKINLFGGSYGTKAALVYLRLHGEHVRSVGLEAVASPQYRIPVPFAKALQSSIDGVIALCAGDASCNKEYPDLRKEFDTIIERLGNSPAHFEVNHHAVTLSREMFVSKLRGLLYIPQFVSAFPLIIHNAYQDNWSLYGNTVMALAGALEAVVARGASFAAICAEDIPGLTESAIRHDTQGTYLGDAQVRRYQKYCEAWGPAGAAPKNFYAAVHSNAPILLISGVLDPATPPAMAEQAAHELTNSRLIAVKQGTHGTGSPCIDGLLAEFVKQGSIAGLDASCADSIHLPPFIAKPAAAAKTEPQKP